MKGERRFWYSPWDRTSSHWF